MSENERSPIRKWCASNSLCFCSSCSLLLLYSPHPPCPMNIYLVSKVHLKSAFSMSFSCWLQQDLTLSSTQFPLPLVSFLRYLSHLLCFWIICVITLLPILAPWETCLNWSRHSLISSMMILWKIRLNKRFSLTQLWHPEEVVSVKFYDRRGKWLPRRKCWSL